MIYLHTADWDDLLDASGEVSVSEQLDQRTAQLAAGEAINIQYTSGTTGFPKGATLSHRNILNNGYFIGEACKYTVRGPGVHPGAVLSLLRDGAGQPGLHYPRRCHGDPRRGVRRRGHPARVRP